MHTRGYCMALQNAVVAVLVHSVQVTDPGYSTLPPPCLIVDAPHCEPTIRSTSLVLPLLLARWCQWGWFLSLHYSISISLKVEYKHLFLSVKKKTTQKQTVIQKSCVKFWFPNIFRCKYLYVNIIINIIIILNIMTIYIFILYIYILHAF